MDKGRKRLDREEIEEAARRRWRYADASSLAFVSLQTKDRDKTARSTTVIAGGMMCAGHKRIGLRWSEIPFPAVARTVGLV